MFLLAAAAGIANAGPIALVSYGETLHILDLDGSNHTQLPIADDITSMAVAPNGTIYAASNSDNDNDGKRELYILTNPTTTPTLTLVGDFLDMNTPALTFIGNQLYGIQSAGGANPDFLVSINPGAQTQSPVGATGEIAGTLRSSAAGYDPIGDTLFALSKSADGIINDVDYVNAPDPSSSLIGNSGEHTGNEGAEYWDGGLYHAFFNFPTLTLRYGVHDPSDGSYTHIATLDPAIDGTGPIGMAIIPAPGTIALSAMAGFVAIRRKR
jgi:hypothetical protein